MPINSIKAVCDGDEESLTEIVRENYDLIIRYCYFKTGNNEVAQDITQETFLRFVGNIENYSDFGKPRAYLYTIARNLCNDWHRQRKDVSIDDTTEIEDSSTDNDMETIVNNLAWKKRISKLHTQQQEVILLRFGQALKLREIARITNTTIFTVQYQLKKALANLKKQLEEE